MKYMVLHFVLLLGLVSCQPGVGVEVKRDVEYASGYVANEAGDDWELRPLLLDIYRPDTAGKNRPALILVHGGSFVTGNKRNGDIVDLARYVAARGWVAFSIEYRLARDSPPAPEGWDVSLIAAFLSLMNQIDPEDVSGFNGAVHANFVDCKAAIRHVRANANAYGINANKIAILGESAGAFGALTAAVTNDNDFAVDNAALAVPAENNAATSTAVAACVDLWGGIPHALDKFDANDPPIMIVHGDKDNVVPFVNAQLIHALVELHGIPHEFYTVDGEGHGAWDYRNGLKRLNTLIYEFLEEQVQGNKRRSGEAPPHPMTEEEESLLRLHAPEVFE